jgi:hypothetical protein
MTADAIYFATSCNEEQQQQQQQEEEEEFYTKKKKRKLLPSSFKEPAFEIFLIPRPCQRLDGVISYNLLQ